MSWLKKAKLDFLPDEKIVAAAVWANKKLHTGPSHYHAMKKALEAGDLYRDEDGYLESIDGDKHLDLFVTNKGTVLDRFQADQYFGISASENMNKQHSPLEAMIRKNNLVFLKVF